MRKLLFVLLSFLLSAVALAAVDLNTASENELETLPGVGPATARAIINARPYNSVADLKGVKGIGDAKFQKIEPLVTATAPTQAAPTPTRVGTIPPQSPAAPSPQANAPAATPPSGLPMQGSAVRMGKAKLAAGEKVNINTAPIEEIEKLPGIGPKKAEAIIQARPFKSPDELMKVKGIKEKTYAKIKDDITVE